MRKNYRCSSYFHPREYVKNNIKYRIASGTAIAKYKHSQAFVFTELSFNPFHDFSDVAKEILLLKYDVWFDYLCEVEQYLLVRHPDTVSETCVKSILEMSNERAGYYERTLLENAEVFDPEYTLMWIEVHKMVYRLFEESIKALAGLSPAEFFTIMVDKLINAMNHTLFELHECDVVMFQDGDLQFNLDSVCCDYHDQFGDSLIFETMKIYNKKRTTDSIVIKQYDDVSAFAHFSLKKTLDDNDIKYKVV